MDNKDNSLGVVRKICIGMIVIDLILAIIGVIEADSITVITKVGFAIVFLAIYVVSEKIERKEKDL